MYALCCYSFNSSSFCCMAVAALPSVKVEEFNCTYNVSSLFICKYFTSFSLFCFIFV